MNPSQMGDFVRQLARIRKDMEKTGAELKSRFVEAQAGGRQVEVVFNGQQELVKLSIKPELVTPAPGSDGKVDVELLEDLIVAAVAQGIEKSKALMKEEMNKASGGLGADLPGFF